LLPASETASNQLCPVCLLMCSERKLLLQIAILFASLAVTIPKARAYAVLSHEEVVDICWTTTIQPALLRRFPQSTPEELKTAHAYAYGGSVIQDIGYYPFGSHEFTNLLHYVRTGNFVDRLVRDSSNVNEYAFALGALAHYVGDSWGHPAVNEAVPIEYPKLRKKHGNVVTYEDDPEAHLKTEFSFDVVQVAKGRYNAKQYHDFIGFEIAQTLLQRAFQETYGISLSEFLHNEELSIGTFRFAVSQVIPEMTKVALAARDHQHLEEKHDAARREFLFHLSRADYEQQFGSDYQRPGFFARFLAFLLKLIPKFGSLKALQYKDPTPQTEDLYIKSMNNVVRVYVEEAHKIEAGKNDLPDRNLDTGDLTKPGQYRLADEAYSELVLLLAKHNFAGVTPGLRENILQYFSTNKASLSLKRKQWRKTEEALQLLKATNAPQTAVLEQSLLPCPEERDAAPGDHFITDKSF
jgi:Zinc dependent phospholipase C